RLPGEVSSCTTPGRQHHGERRYFADSARPGAQWSEGLVNWPQLIFAVALLVIGSAFIAYNAMIFWLTVVRKEEAPSVAPIVGSVIAAAGIVALPVTGSWQWAWIPLAIDWGGFRIFVSHWFSRRAKS
ncbi:MAG TPA: hypothetical protein VD840_16940, partial [Sinorhizobium sp.]|nr:hypothetical protein [Sinorhizobium sp.]